MPGWRRTEWSGGERLTVAGTGGACLSFADVIAGWRDDRAFRADTVAALAHGAPAYFWEMPPLDGRTAALPFECSLVPGDALLRPEPDPTPFAAQFAAKSMAQPAGRSAGARPGSVVSFRNLGGDATLLVPRPLSPASSYGHAAAFFRTAPPEQGDEMLRALGTLAAGSIADRPVWISTAGLGVPWLHVRFDARPKYYRTRAYRDPAWGSMDPAGT